MKAIRLLYCATRGRGREKKWKRKITNEIKKLKYLQRYYVALTQKDLAWTHTRTPHSKWAWKWKCTCHTYYNNINQLIFVFPRYLFFAAPRFGFNVVVFFFTPIPVTHWTIPKNCAAKV